MRRLLASLFFVSLAVPPGLAAAVDLQTRSFEAQPGDTLIIENDYGGVRVRQWKEPTIQVRIRRIAADPLHLQNVQVSSHRNGAQVLIRSSFYLHSAESVYIEVEIPSQVNVVVWGASPAVELSRLEGEVRVHTLTGLITVDDLTSSVSLLSESGDILFRARLQPVGDIRLESSRGNVRCELNRNLNLRGWARAGGVLSWGQALEMKNGSLEKELGQGGPLFFARSSHGNVTVQFRQETASQVAGFREPEPEPVAPDLPSANSAPSSPSPPPGPAGLPPVAENPPPAPEPDVAGSPAPRQGGFSLKIDVDYVYLNTSVRDRRTNRSIPDLTRENFEVYEDGVLQRIEQFEPTEAPFRLLLLLDVSGSTRSKMGLIRQASIDFTREIKENDEIAVAVFNSRARLIQDFTSNRYQVARSIERIRSGGGTAFYDALDRSLNDFMRGLEGRKAIVVFTDGVDNQLVGDYANGSQVPFDDLFREVQESDTIIYTIFLNTERRGFTARRGGGLGGILGDILRGGNFPAGGIDESRAYQIARQQLEAIAEQTGGRMYSPRRTRDLASVYSQIANDLRVQYRLAYNSTNPAHDGSWRRIQVKIRGRSGAVARTRKGYYARRRSGGSP